MAQTIGAWVIAAEQQLLASGSLSARCDAEVLAMEAADISRAKLLGFPELPLKDTTAIRLNCLLSARIRGLPIAYLLGKKEFWSLPIKVNDTTLIPRPETELLVELALEYLRGSASRILELGTGSGAIALALARERPDCRIVATDISIKAVEIATENKQVLNIPQISIRQGNWFDAVENESFDMIISNPPYLDVEDEHLMQGDIRFEPKAALVAADRGFADLLHIIKKAPEHFHEKGILLLEHGYQQAKRVREALQDNGYAEIVSYHDLAGYPRVAAAQWIENADTIGSPPA